MQNRSMQAFKQKDSSEIGLFQLQSADLFFLSSLLSIKVFKRQGTVHFLALNIICARVYL